MEKKYQINVVSWVDSVGNIRIPEKASKEICNFKNIYHFSIYL
jgi:hypothetical protein